MAHCRCSSRIRDPAIAAYVTFRSTAWAFPACAVAVLFGRAVSGGRVRRAAGPDGAAAQMLAGYACLAVGLTAIVAGLGPQFDVPAALTVGLGYSFPWPALASVVVSQVPVSDRAAGAAASMVVTIGAGTQIHVSWGLAVDEVAEVRGAVNERLSHSTGAGKILQ